MNQHGGLKRLKEYVVSVQFQIASFNTWQYIHLEIMGSRLESSHGMDCSGIRAWAGTGHWKQVLKDEERGKRNELELEQDVQMCNVLRHFSAWTTGLCSLDGLTKVHTPTCRRTAMNMKRRTRVGQPVSLHNSSKSLESGTRGATQQEQK